MNKIDFSKYSKFPVSAETFQFMQSMINLMAKTACLGGSNYILDGCIESGSTVSSGTVIIAGEILPFTGGTKTDYIVISETTSSVQIYDTTYSDLYTTRKVIFGTGSGQIAWSSFKAITTLMDLSDNKAESSDLEKHTQDTTVHITSNERTSWNNANAPVGSIVIWPGDIGKVPTNWKICDGSSLSITDYAALFSAIGTTYGGDTSTFKLPAMGGRFVVGYDSTEIDYSTVGNKGGEKKHILTLEELPSHTHDLETTSGDKIYIGNSNDSGMSNSFREDSNKDLGESPWRAKAAGSGSAHENRPPYIAMPYIIKTK